MSGAAGSLLIDGIGELTTNAPELVRLAGRTGAADSPLLAAAEALPGRIEDAAIVFEHGRVAWVGRSAAAPAADERVEAGGRALLPGWVDSHTHLLFAGDRSAEFEARMAGEPYAAGGIGVTVAATRAADDEALRANLRRLAAEARRGGTTAFETKTGYGLTVADEARAARIAAEEADAVTFLGAHIVPPGEVRERYLELVTGEMLAAVLPYADAIDVFCEQGAFDEAESLRVLRAGRERGLAVRVHGNQLGPGPGVRVALECGALSVDHLGFPSERDLARLADSWAHGRRGTVATVLPACDLSTRVPLAPARGLVDAGCELAIASNCNPGTSYTSSMAFCVAIAVLQMRLTIAEAVRAATLGGALALDRHLGDGGTGRGPAPLGSLVPGARADAQLLAAPSVSHLAYRPGMPLALTVWRAGRGEPGAARPLRPSESCRTALPGDD